MIAMNENLLREFLQSVHEHPLSAIGLSSEQCAMRDRCEEERFIRHGVDGTGRPVYFLTAHGEQTLASLNRNLEDARQKQSEEQAAKEADKMEQKLEATTERKKIIRHDYAIATYGFILGVLSTLIAEHFDEIIEFINLLFAR